MTLESHDPPLNPELTRIPDSPLQAQPPAPPSPWPLRVVAVAALLGVLMSAWLWGRLSHIQEQLARQSADTSGQALEAKTSARQAEELARETAAKVAVSDAKIAEVALQRSQLEELMQSLSRSRDENLVVDIESAIRLAQQQAQLTGSVQPLLAALKASEQRLGKVAQPRLAPVMRALARDIERIKTTAFSDTPTLLAKMDDLVSAVDGLPLLNAVGTSPTPLPAPEKSSSWASAIRGSAWESWWSAVWDDLRKLVRVSRIDHPDASLLSPQQSFFIRENLKLRLLNARLGLLARQFDAVQTDLRQVQTDLQKYFDVRSPQGQSALQLTRDLLAQARQTELPRVDDTLSALATAAAGR